MIEVQLQDVRLKKTTRQLYVCICHGRKSNLVEIQIL